MATIGYNIKIVINFYAKKEFQNPYKFLIINDYWSNLYLTYEKWNFLQSHFYYTFNFQPSTLRKKCYWIKSISFQKHVYHGFKSICCRISNIFIGLEVYFYELIVCMLFGKKCFWFNSIFFSVPTILLYYIYIKYFWRF